MKKLIALVLALVCVAGFVGCSNRSMNYIISNEPSMTGIVKEPNENILLIENENGEYWVSLNVENKDSMTVFNIGDEVVVYYDGNVAESYPMQINTVYAITLKTPADRTKEELSDLIPMVMVNGELYLDTGHESTVEARCGMMDGEITSKVDGSEKPTEDNQSNFGTGYGYQYGSIEGTIEIYMDEKWWVFATEKVLASSELMIEPVAPEVPETRAFHDKTIDKSDLSKETYGITLSLEDITATGAMIKCERSGGEATGELQTGSWYIVERWTQTDGWKEVETVLDKQQVGWTAEAYVILEDCASEWEVNWEWLYGELPAGKYRIGKQIMDWRAPGDYDTVVYYTEFDLGD